jgi:hypothetical protein
MYRGSQYAIMGTGGFQIADSTRQIKMQGVPHVAKVDVTLATQFLFPSDILNQLFANESLSSSSSSIRISSDLFLSNISSDSVVSVGNFENLFQNYAEFVQQKMGHPFKYNSLFDTGTQATTRVFNTRSFYDLLQGSRVDSLGNVVPALNGEILLLDVSRTLADIRLMNVFGNSNSSNTGSVTIFLPGDLIYISDGFSIEMTTTLSTKVDILGILQTRIRPSTLSSVLDNSNFSNRYSSSIMLRLT